MRNSNENSADNVDDNARHIHHMFRWQVRVKIPMKKDKQVPSIFNVIIILLFLFVLPPRGLVWSGRLLIHNIQWAISG